MARKTRQIPDDVSSDDDAPEVVSYSTSKADAKRNQKALRDFEAEEKARRKALNRGRDQKLKERARVTRGGKLNGVQLLEQQDVGDRGEVDGDDEDVETRMLRAMRDAAGEVESGEGEADDDDDSDHEFQGMDSGNDMVSGSSAHDDDDDESDSIDSEARTDDEEMDEDDGTTLLPANSLGSSRKAGYLADDLFAAAFASQNSTPAPKINTESAQQQAVKERRRKSTARPKDLVIGGRTIRTLPRLSDPRSQATARSVPLARTRRFIDQSLALKGKQALLKAKKRGWERRPANVGVMKLQGAPHGFARSTR